MAFDFTKLNFFSRLEARERMFVVLGAVLGLIGIIYLLSVYFSSGQATVGPSQVAGAPRGLQSVPGGELTAEYSRALQQANSQSAQQAQMTGTSAVPTLMNYGGNNNAGPSSNCNVICTEKADNVKYSLDEWVKKGTIAPEVATALQQMANRRAPVSEFEMQLAQLVKEGKLAPEQARELLERYKKQYQNGLLEESALAMDQQIKAGALSLDVANDLLAAQKDKMPQHEYEAKIQKLVDEDKLPPELGRQLAAQYGQQLAKEKMNERVAAIHEMARNGQIIPEVEKELVALEQGDASLDDYTKKVQQYVADGKMTPAVADKLIDGYRDAKLDTLTASMSADQRVKKAEDELYNSVDGLVKNGKIAPETAQAITGMARKNVSNEEFAANMQQLVQDGKISPELAQAKIGEYKALKTLRDSQGSAVTNSAIVKKAEDAVVAGLQDLVTSGKINAETAKELTDLVKKNASPTEYKAAVQRLVSEGKLPPDIAQAKIDEYESLDTLRNTKGNLEVVKKAEDALYQKNDDLVKEGKITEATARELNDMVKKNIPADEYEANVKRLVQEGKLPPELAAAKINEYKTLKLLRDTPDSLQMVRQAEEDTYRGIDGLVKAGLISADTGQQLSDAVQKNISPIAFKEMVDKLVTEGKIPPDVAKAATAQYEKVRKLRDMRDSLQEMQANKVPVGQYQDKLQQLVQDRVITPEQATQLLNEYAVSKTAAPLAVDTRDLSDLDKSVAKQLAQIQLNNAVQDKSAFVAPPPEVTQGTQIPEAEAMQQVQANVDATMAAMQGQATQLVASWQPATMAHTQGSGDDKSGKAGDGKLGPDGKPVTDKDGKGASAAKGPALIKAGTIAFAVLDTAANSDYPDSPIMATIVEGPLKNAKLLGKLVVAKGVTGQMDKITLNFTLMNYDPWPTAKAVNCYAIDPDTARTVLASHVDYHYMQKFGAIMATSFLTGYASAITQAGTSTTGIFGTSTTHPELSPSQKIFTALGQMGTTLGAATQKYIEIPPTVKVDAGVGLGILFMADVTG